MKGDDGRLCQWERTASDYYLMTKGNKGGAKGEATGKGDAGDKGAGKKGGEDERGYDKGSGKSGGALGTMDKGYMKGGPPERASSVARGSMPPPEPPVKANPPRAAASKAVTTPGPRPKAMPDSQPQGRGLE